MSPLHFFDGEWTAMFYGASGCVFRRLQIYWKKHDIFMDRRPGKWEIGVSNYELFFYYKSASCLGLAYKDSGRHYTLRCSSCKERSFFYTFCLPFKLFQARYFVYPEAALFTCNYGSRTACVITMLKHNDNNKTLLHFFIRYVQESFL